MFCLHTHVHVYNSVAISNFVKGFSSKNKYRGFIHTGRRRLGEGLNTSPTNVRIFRRYESWYRKDIMSTPLNVVKLGVLPPPTRLRYHSFVVVSLSAGTEKEMSFRYRVVRNFLTSKR